MIGDYCRAHSDTPEHMAADGYVIGGCSGEGRPTCKAGECLYGAEPCPMGNHFKPEMADCNYHHSRSARKAEDIRRKFWGIKRG